MQVTQERVEPCQVALTIEVEGDKVLGAVDRAYREYAKYVSVPGFRKGKAPMHIVRQRVPQSDIRQRAAELLVEPAYEEAIKQESVEPYGRPKLELVHLDLEEKPFVFKAIVPLAPEIEIGTYKGLEVEHKRYELTDDDIETQLQRLRERAADYPVVDRSAQIGDVVMADVAASTPIRPEAAEPRPTMIEIGGDNIPGFDDNIVGMSIGDERTFSLTYPAAHHEVDLAGQPAVFTVLVKEVREKSLPELNEELAKKISNGRADTIEDLRQTLRTDMDKSLRDSAENEADGALIEQIINNSSIKYPPNLADAEVESDAKKLMERLERENVSLEDYLHRTGKSREQLTAEFQHSADRRLKVGLILSEIAEKEDISLSDADVDTVIAEQSKQQGSTPAAMRAMLEANNAMDSLRNRALTKKVLDFIRSTATIQEKVVQANAEDAETSEVESDDDSLSDSTQG